MPNTFPVSNVCCVILTFNRLPALKKCLERIQTQTRRPETIHVVNNGSSQDTIQFLNEAARTDSSIVVSSLPENSGPAGGYAYGLKWAVENQFRYIWVMDDDVFAEGDCLQKLLQHMEDGKARIVYPRVFDKDNRPANYPAWVGVLIPSSVVQLAGVPKTELFWWTEDTEYLQWRLPKIYGITPLISSDATVNHGVDDGKEKPAWKYYYEVRNTIYYRSYIQRGHRIRRIRKMSLAVIKPMIRAVFEKNKMKKLKLVFLGIYDGVLCRLGKRIDPAR
jgi:rhamnopyranosyl-N-acetylglucosaminyl-diphospho-decaprenol beta-1,3/1,4-galactofuranosyltransferase